MKNPAWRALLALLAWLFLILSSSAQAQTSVTNIATISPPVSVTNSNPSPSCTAGVCSAADTDAVATSADLTVTKVASAVSGTSGGTISYTVALVNRGPSVASNVTLTDILSAGLSLVSASGNNGTTTIAGTSAAATTTTLAVGQTLTLVVTASVTASSGTVTNTAVGLSTTPDPTPSNTVTVPVPVVSSADLTVTKV
ncbi:MAG: DUF11 domain-containing protein, partial [Burkholderiales bacterium]